VYLLVQFSSVKVLDTAQTVDVEMVCTAEAHIPSSTPGLRSLEGIYSAVLSKIVDTTAASCDVSVTGVGILKTDQQSSCKDSMRFSHNLLS